MFGFKKDTSALQWNDLNAISQLSELEKESYQIQLKAGLISASEFKYQELNWQEAEINLKSARDEVFIDKLRLAQFLGFRKSS